MKISIYSKFSSKAAAPVMESIKKGLSKLGHSVVEHDERADMAVICSTLWLGRMTHNKKVFETYRRSKRNVLVLDAGALKRGELWKLGLNAVHSEGYFGSLGNDRSRRDKLGIILEPWKKQAGPLLICTQQHKSHLWTGMPSMQVWVNQIIILAKKQGWHNIILRPHPRAGMVFPQVRSYGVKILNPKKIATDEYDFFQAIKNAGAVVSYSSTPGIIAALNGIPVFVGKTSLAYSVRCGDLEELKINSYPDREQWLNDLVYTEWTKEELEEGTPINRLLN